MINESMINEICINYPNIRDKVEKYIQTIYFKDFLIKLFIKMLEYNIDSKLLTLMKELIMKSEFDYFDKYLMTHFILLNTK